jgi:hypothetical protein
MAAVDFDLKFTYVLTSWEGSAHDALILADAIERDDGLLSHQVTALPSQCTFILALATLALIVDVHQL